MASAPRREIEQLRARDHPVLPGGERRDRLLNATRRTFGVYDAPNVRLVRHPPRVALRALRISTQTQRFCADSVAELRAPPRHVLLELSVDARVDRWLLVLLDRLAPDLARALGRVA